MLFTVCVVSQAIELEYEEDLGPGEGFGTEVLKVPNSP